MAEIVALNAEPSTDPRIVEILETALEKARVGVFSSVAIAVVLRDGASDCLWSNPPNRPLLLGSIGRLAHRFNRMMDKAIGE